jgi:two-component system, OmpR family, sensor histidine kinase BaeS
MNRISFPVRVFLHMIAVAATAAGAIVWLIMALDSITMAKTPPATAGDLDHVVEELTTHAMLHNTWSDTADLVQKLTEDTGQRIRLQAPDGAPLLDSDPSDGAVPPEFPAVIETRPALQLDTIPSSQQATVAVETLWRYRDNLRLAACWQSHGADLKVTTTPLGIKMLVPDPRPAPGENCVPQTVDARLFAEEVAGIEKLCVGVSSGCVQAVFAQRFAELAPPSTVVQIGNTQTPPWDKMEMMPTLVTTGAIAFVVVTASSLLISRRVLRPIRALATAARQLGQGDLSGRVPVQGHDELTDLSRSFNRMAESLQRSKEQQHNMIADITHELRTPTTNIRGYVEALQDGVFSLDEELLRSLYEEAVLQQRLIDDLQDLALAEAGALVYHRCLVDLADFLRSVHTAHKPTVTTQNVRLELDAATEVSVTVDPDRLRQVIGNLITNSLRATAPGGQITLRSRAEKDTAVIEVADTGSGIAAEDLPHLFDRFWRADNSRSRHTGGRGLGLAIAREIVNAHRGAITVVSTVGSGTTVTVRLPLAQGEAGQIRPRRNA